MTLQPDSGDYKAWAKLVPHRGDLIFLDGQHLALLKELKLPWLTAREVNDRAVELWTLNHRSWYGHTLARFTHALWLPAGQLESLPSTLRAQLARVQIQKRVPTLIRTSLLPAKLHRNLANYGRHTWLSAQAWRQLSEAGRSEFLGAWYHQLKLKPAASAPESLSLEQKTYLRKNKMFGLVNSFAKNSGPNCFAFVAAAVAQQWSLAQQWLHADALLRTLKTEGYTLLSNPSVRLGDVLVLRRQANVVHAALALGDDIFMEKSGQDFYEPYRLVRWKTGLADWPRTTLDVWRKNVR